jgi:hypothetical protein
VRVERRGGCAQGRPGEAQGDAVVLQAVEQGIDQGLIAEQVVPLIEVEVLCTVHSYAEKAIRGKIYSLKTTR